MVGEPSNATTALKMSKMSKKLTAKEREKLAQELIAADLDLDLLGPSGWIQCSFNLYF